RERQHDAQHHQCQEGGQEPAVDRPPPVGDRSPFDAAHHHCVPPIGVTPSSWCTAARNASPRTSKFLNWSKLAQAGESSTTLSSAGSAAASPAACSTAASSVPEISYGTASPSV